MKAVSVSLLAFALAFALLGCGKNNNDLKTLQTSAPNNMAASLPSVTPAEIDEQRFAFRNDNDELQVNATTKIVSKEFRDENKPLKFEVDVSFPQFEGSLSSTQKRFNLAVAGRARKEFAEYRRRELQPVSKAQRFPRYHEDVVEYLQVSYDVPFFTENLVNVRFYASTYGRGAAHAVDYFFVFNYDLESGNQIKLSDLLETREGLRRVSSYSSKNVKRKICSEGGWGEVQTFDGCLEKVLLWDEGLKPTLRNFKAWNITREGLLFSFDPCQLTGCAGGEFYVTVPYSEMKNFIKPNKLISKLPPR